MSIRCVRYLLYTIKAAKSLVGDVTLVDAPSSAKTLGLSWHVRIAVHTNNPR